MADQPSWKNSTLSQLMVLTVTAFLTAAGGVGIGVILNKITIEIASSIMQPFKWAAEIFISTYLVARKTDNGTSQSVTTPKEVP